MPANDKTSKLSIFSKAGSMTMASISWQSSRYSSFKTDPSEAAKWQMPLDVSREHWLRLMDLKAGTDETKTLNPVSESRYAPLNDSEISADKLCGERATVVVKI